MTYLIVSSLTTAARAAFGRRVALASGLRSAPVATMRLQSTQPPMPYGDDKMTFYALGANLALQASIQVPFSTVLDEDEMEVCLDGFCQTFRGAAVADPRTVLSTYGTALNQMLQERTRSLVDRIKKDGDEFRANFLESNPGAIQTKSGLVYYEMEAGEGKVPALRSTVEVHYHGTLPDGSVFDSSVDRGQTICFPLAGVIQGWVEGLQLMKEGGKATLVIPGDLAYGDTGSGDGTCQ